MTVNDALSLAAGDYRYIGLAIVFVILWWWLR